jgi:peroxiredoxin
VKRIALFLLTLSVAFGALLCLPGSSDAAANRKVPAFELRDLQERELRLSDERFRGKTLLIVAFSTWNDASVEQARQVQAFHKAHPEVEIIAFVANALPEARDFVAAQGLTYPCYKVDAVTRIGTAFNRLFETKRGKTVTLNRYPFAILADKDRNVRFSVCGPASSETLSTEYAKFK